MHNPKEFNSINNLEIDQLLLIHKKQFVQRPNMLHHMRRIQDQFETH